MYMICKKIHVIKHSKTFAEYLVSEYFLKSYIKINNVGASARHTYCIYLISITMDKFHNFPCH